MEVYGGVLPQKNGSPIFPGNTFRGPLLAGSIPKSSSQALGGQAPQPAGLGGTIGLANLGYAVMAQSAVITQAAAAAPTPIVIPAQSQITRITLMATTAFSGGANTISIGNAAGGGADLAALTAVAALGPVAFGPGASAPVIARWDNVGNVDMQISVTSANGGTGVGTLTVEYLQGVNNAS